MKYTLSATGPDGFLGIEDYYLEGHVPVDEFLLDLNATYPDHGTAETVRHEYWRYMISDAAGELREEWPVDYEGDDLWQVIVVCSETDTGAFPVTAVRRLVDE